MGESERVALLREIYSAMPEDIVPLMRDDAAITAFRERFRPHVTEDFGIHLMGDEDSGFDERYDGLEGFTEGWRGWIGPFERYEVVFEQYVDGEEAVLIDARQRAFLKGSSEPVETRAAAVYRFRGMKVHSVEFHTDRERAHRVAGLTEA